MTISGIVKSSLVDYPGLVCCVLFVPGCNFDCYFCHNRRLLEGGGDKLTGGYIDSFLSEREGFLDAVAISGGEPTLMRDLPEFVRYLKGFGYKVKVDTNGSSPETVEKLIKYGCDYFAVDYKAPAAMYRGICRGCADARNVIDTIKLLARSGAEFEVRTTVIPELDEKALLEIAAELPRVPRYVLNRYKKPEYFLPGDEQRIEAPALSAAEIKSIVLKLKKYQPDIVI